MDEGSLDPLGRSKDFFAIFLAEQRNERLAAASLSAQTVAAEPSPSQQPRSTVSIWNPPAIPEEKVVVKLLPLVLNITSKQHVNFTHTATQFQIEVENVPAKLSVGSDMIEANAFAPSGEGYQCAIRKEKRKARIFSGHFRTREETGFYELHVRLNVPKEFWDYAKDGAVIGRAKLFVSKNNLMDSQHEPIYGLPSPMGNLGYSKVSGLTCDTSTNQHLYYSDRNTNKTYCVDPEGRIISSFGQPAQPGTVGVNRQMEGWGTIEPMQRRLVGADKDNRTRFFTPGGEQDTASGRASGGFN
ncbi:hypothetical protein Ocin01_13249 [Orchesella cincta]|uniref:Uncharacterized protein n=1 Tax=Orchesella cincta TaxID=48709 RepID=A0A1D2MK45_ORCCI|nr:hypothetical protein Ocin01_13249 [Orchesella cincta]